MAFLILIALTTAPVAAVAAYSIGNQMERIVRLTLLAFGTAATTLVGQNLGAKNPQAAAQSGWTAPLVGTSSMILLGLPLAIFAPEFMRLFTSDPAIIQTGTIYLYAGRDNRTLPGFSYRDRWRTSRRRRYPSRFVLYHYQPVAGTPTRRLRAGLLVGLGYQWPMDLPGRLQHPPGHSDSAQIRRRQMEGAVLLDAAWVAEPDQTDRLLRAVRTAYPICTSMRSKILNHCPTKYYKNYLCFGKY